MYHHETTSDQTELNFGEKPVQPNPSTEVGPTVKPNSVNPPTTIKTAEEDEFADGSWGELGYRKR